MSHRVSGCPDGCWAGWFYNQGCCAIKERAMPSVKEPVGEGKRRHWPGKQQNCLANLTNDLSVF